MEDNKSTDEIELFHFYGSTNLTKNKKWRAKTSLEDKRCSTFFDLFYFSVRKRIYKVGNGFSVSLSFEMTEWVEIENELVAH